MSSITACEMLSKESTLKDIQVPRYKGAEITIDEALLKLKEMIDKSPNNEILYYGQSSNDALTQEICEHFFSSYGATLTDGSLYGGAGESGIIQGRGSNKNMPLQEVSKSEVVIFWGRDPDTTSSHILPLIKDKTIIVIDPIRTEIAKIADLHIQLKPHTDLFLAMLLSRFLHIENSCDEEFLNKYASGYEEYYELTQNLRIKATLEQIDVSLGQLGDVLRLVKDKKVAIVCGAGVQKYSDGVDVMRAIDAFAVMLGLFGKEGCGVNYVGSSKESINSPFKKSEKKVSKVNTEFSNFKTIFIQGANPLSEMPDSLRVKESISKVENVVYFGLYENETSETADLVIPAKSFLYKDEVRVSSSISISEYALTSYLCKAYALPLESEEFYTNYFKDLADELSNVDKREKIPYKNGFDTKDKEFVFLEEVDFKVDEEDGLYLITCKSQNSLNSQFNPEKSVYLHSSLGFSEDEVVTISSKNGSVELKVKYNDDLRADCVLIYSTAKGLNNLTSSKHALSTKSAIFQENKVEIKR